ncbi:CU044_5270 family protein [Streptomyces sp. RerS4]|uniref:CU044_5270 family protein n=1 Tax=Streptomyces sp. RerS4 TaxID=2942449 RepID=UPI00201BB6D4|nr:CU044_5270 family protein [Streptomyces sp. RerS4]UQX02450.1 CU044_5270 family protein [Streptomyces sp. RerS4]
MNDAHETLRRLPGVADADLPFAGERRLREHLLSEAVVGARRAGRRPFGLVLAAGVATCAVALAVSLGTGGGGSGVRPPEPAAVQLLDRVALTAQEQPAATVRDDQFLYTKTVGHSTTLSETKDGGMEAFRTDESAERWVSVNGSVGTLVRTADGTSREPTSSKGNAEPSINGPTYRFLEALPTDPDKLLKLIYADVRVNHGPDSGSTLSTDQHAFVAIGDLLRTVNAPPGVSAALYRAAARIPGVVFVPEATDAAGRSGVAVARVDRGERTEWIFDAATLRLLGERTVALKDSHWARAGEPVTSVAFVGRGVVDEAGERPQ